MEFWFCLFGVEVIYNRRLHRVWGPDGIVCCCRICIGGRFLLVCLQGLRRWQNFGMVHLGVYAGFVSFLYLLVGGSVTFNLGFIYFVSLDALIVVRP